MIMRKKKKYLFLTLLVVIGLPLLFYSFTFSKYISDSIWDYYLQSRGFYFTSDYLGEDIVQNIDNLWDGGSVHFNVKNNLNEKVVTSYDIEYQVTCTVKGEVADHVSCKLNGTDSDTHEGILSSFQTCANNTGDGIDVSSLSKTDCELGGYKWITEVAAKDLYFDILVDDDYELNDFVVNITATSTHPYNKSIGGDFTLHKRNVLEEVVTMNYKNYTNYDRLVVSNSHSSEKCVKITWDSDKLVIDADETKFNSYMVDSDNYINGVKFNIAGKESQNYVFYKKDFNETYNVNEFTLTELDDC